VNFFELTRGSALVVDIHHAIGKALALLVKITVMFLN
jgi:hypothetical protein